MIFNVKVYRNGKYVTSEYFDTYDEAFAFGETQNVCYYLDFRIYMYDYSLGKFRLCFKSMPSECC